LPTQATKPCLRRKLGFFSASRPQPHIFPSFLNPHRNEAIIVPSNASALPIEPVRESIGACRTTQAVHTTSFDSASVQILHFVGRIASAFPGLMCVEKMEPITSCAATVEDLTNLSAILVQRPTPARQTDHEGSISPSAKAPLGVDIDPWCTVELGSTHRLVTCSARSTSIVATNSKVLQNVAWVCHLHLTACCTLMVFEVSYYLIVHRIIMNFALPCAMFNSWETPLMVISK
jgi:hypothetical protein